MPPVRVLVIDDSVVARRLLVDIVASSPDLEVAGIAASASIAFQRIPQLSPDVVVLDVEMPDMDGIETVKRLRASWPKLPVLMCSSMTSRGAEISFRAIYAGASDCIAKPTSASGGANDPVFRRELIEKLRALGAARQTTARQVSLAPPPSQTSIAPRSSMTPAAVRPSMAPRASVAPPGFRPSLVPAFPRPTLLPGAARASMPPPRIVTPRRSFGPVDVLAIGCSTGGPNALGRIFARLPSQFPVPILVVQHMPPLFTRMLAERLSASSPVRVEEATPDQVLRPGHAYVAPGDFHLTVARREGGVFTCLDKNPHENFCRPAVDVLFRSVAQVYGPGVLACVLTGMGQDGTLGARHIVDGGGSVFVQDAASCVVPSMPRAVVTAGLTDRVVPLDDIAGEIVSRVATRLPGPQLRQGAG